MEDAITDSVGRLLGAQRRRRESNSGYTSQTSAGPWVGDTNRSISDVAIVYFSPDEHEAYLSDAVGSAAKASCSSIRRLLSDARRAASRLSGVRSEGCGSLKARTY